jgi:hypothetical protein
VSDLPESAREGHEIVRLVFDARLWGGKDHPDGNERYWKRATILALQGRGEREMATVKFHHDGRVSRGHFTSMMRDA